MNCHLLKLTGQVCEVSGFTNSIDSIMNVPIANVAMAVTLDRTGETVILVFNQFLWFGWEMSHTLFNPNQLRHFGIPVSDNITNHNCPFGIQVDDNTLIPFQM